MSILYTETFRRFITCVVPDSSSDVSRGSTSETPHWVKGTLGFKHTFSAESQRSTKIELMHRDLTFTTPRRSFILSKSYPWWESEQLSSYETRRFYPILHIPTRTTRWDVHLTKVLSLCKCKPAHPPRNALNQIFSARRARHKRIVSFNSMCSRQYTG